MNRVTTQRPSSLRLSAVYCVTTLWWSLSIIGAASAQDGFALDRLVPASVTTLQSTFARPIGPAGPFLDRADSFHGLLESDLATDPRVFPPFVQFASYHSVVTHAWSVPQSSFERPHVDGNRMQPILVSTGRSYAMMPLEVNLHVQRILDYYQHDIHNRFQKYLDRFEKYKGLVQRTFKDAGLPIELGYLSLVESGFNPRALSSASASGPWQFMKPTGRAYGLDVTWYVDERRDPVKSTVAAAQHLRDLFDQFKSWPLALGAYNAGGSKIQRAIRKSGSRDFWKIRKTGYIRRETKDYVPSFIAAVLIASNPTQYGFKVNTTSPYAYHEALVRKRTHLKAVAKTTGISFGTLKELNPELRQNIVPILEDGYSLKVPQGKGVLVRERHDQIEMWAKLPPVSATWYRVRFGDTLDDVARRFGLTKQELKRLNSLKEDRIRWNDRLRLRNEDDSAPIALEAESSPPATWYRVRFGDTLASVAQEFGLTKKDLRRLNNLKEDRIRWNDQLRVRGEEDEHPSLVPPSEPTPPANWYHVRFGDTLASVAKEFDLTKKELKRLNDLKDDRIRWNDRLRVGGKKDDNVSLVSQSEPSLPDNWYRVHYGDTLASVAREFGLSEKELKRLNNLKEDRLRWNSRLRIRAERADNPSLAPQSEPSPPTTWYRIHSGDTLSGIAVKFGLSVKALKRLNNLKSDRIRANARLRVRAEDDNSPVAFNSDKDKR